ncbi:MAG: PD40 domain-containing protein [Bacteroidetes bacterium]|nr:PD40 domain-containing protein [Bacteroidota bacterium]
MRIRYLLFFLLISIVVTAQPKTYKDYFVEANYLILEDNYKKALDNFLFAYDLDSTGANINYNIGQCYLKTSAQKKNALYYLQQAVAMGVTENYNPLDYKEKNAPVTVYYYLGRAYHLNGLYDKAIENFEKYKSYLKQPKNAALIKDTDHQIEMCKNAKELIAMPTRIKITNLGDSINSEFPEYSPVVSADESMLIYTSRRPGSTGGEIGVDDQFYEDIYVSVKGKDDRWSTPVSIGESINTNGHEATISLSADGMQLFIYKDDNGDGNIYVSNLLGDTWSSPVKMGSDINSTYWEPSICVTPDGNTLYFVSDRKGGLGGRDIYRCVRLPNGEWSKALNLGPSINTEYDEDGPFIHPDRVTLFFSSKGHKSMGGFDLFYATKTDSGWTSPTNLLPPINTPDDDIFYMASTDGRRAYFSSLREDGFGDKDIYMLELEDAPKVDPVALVIGRLVADQGSTLPNNIDIRVVNTETNEQALFKANIKSGKYVLPLVPGKSYNVSYKVGDAEFYNETINVPTGTDYQEIQKELLLDPVNLKGVMKEAPKQDLKHINELPKDKTPQSNAEAKNKIADTEKKAGDSTPINYGQEVYKVRISSVKKPAAYDAFKGLKNVEYEQTADGYYRYYVGTYNSKVEAKERKEEIIKAGVFTDAIVIKYTGTLLPFNSTKPNTLNTEALTTFSDNTFLMYFKYNATEINSTDNDFVSFVNAIAQKLSVGAATIEIESSASHVPTRKYSDNKELAKYRAENAKQKIMDALNLKNAYTQKLTINSNKFLVGGPEYSGDYLLNKAEYEKHQFVKVKIATN